MQNEMIKAVRLNNYFMDLYTTQCGKRLCRFQLHPSSNRVLDGKLTENILHSYIDYYLDIVKDTFENRKYIVKKNRIIDPVELNNRIFVVHVIGNNNPLGVFKLSIVEHYSKDARFISKIVAAYEEYYKDLRLYFSSKCYYGY